MIVVVLLFLLGGSVYNLLCQPWSNGQLLEVTILKHTPARTCVCTHRTKMLRAEFNMVILSPLLSTVY